MQNNRIARRSGLDHDTDAVWVDQFDAPLQRACAGSEADADRLASLEHKRIFVDIPRGVAESTHEWRRIDQGTGWQQRIKRCR